MKLKILIIKEANPYVDSNASNNRFLSLVEGLNSLGVSVHVLIIQSYNSRSEKIKFNSIDNHNNIRIQYISPYYVINSIARRVLNKYLFKNPNYVYYMLQRKVDFKDYDYTWLDTGGLMTSIGVRLMKTVKETLFFQERSEYSWIGFYSDKRHQKYLKEFLPRIDCFAVMTVTLKKYYKEYLNNDIKLVHLPMTVDLERFEDSKNISDYNNREYIGYCGTMKNEKDGVDILVKSFVKIMDDFPHIDLHLAGPLLPKVDYEIQQEIIAHYNAFDRIKYIGSLSRKDIPDFLFNSKILAMARPDSKQAQGGFPTKLGEYLATGRPVCATKVGEIEDYLEHEKSAYLAEPGSVDSFSKVLKNALLDDNSEEVGYSGKQIARTHFNKDIQSKELYNFFIANK